MLNKNDNNSLKINANNSMDKNLTNKNLKNDNQFQKIQKSQNKNSLFSSWLLLAFKIEKVF
jgi:hypothetical protein